MFEIFLLLLQGNKSENIKRQTEVLLQRNKIIKVEVCGVRTFVMWVLQTKHQEILNTFSFGGKNDKMDSMEI